MASTSAAPCAGTRWSDLVCRLSSPPPARLVAQQKLEATRAGAWDFFGQPLDGELVLAKVETFLRAADALRSIRAESLLHETASEPTSA